MGLIIQHQGERRVAKKKHVAAQKRSEEKGAEAPVKAGTKPLDSAAAMAQPKTNFVAASVKKPFNYRRSGG